MKYHSGRVDRPISRLVRVVKADEEISKKGKTICPYALADEDIQAGWNDDSEAMPAQNKYDMDRNLRDDDQNEDLQEALQPHVPEEDAGQEVRRHPQGVPPPHLPRSQEMAQEEDGDEEKLETQEDFLTVEERSQPLPPQDSTLPQGALPNKGSQGRPQRRKRPLDKF